jgi:hypothetical protein
MYELLTSLATDGLGVLLISSDAEGILGRAHVRAAPGGDPLPVPHPVHRAVRLERGFADLARTSFLTVYAST